MSASRIEIAKAFAREQIDRNPSITVAIVTGSTARNDSIEASDRKAKANQWQVG